MGKMAQVVEMNEEDVTSEGHAGRRILSAVNMRCMCSSVSCASLVSGSALTLTRCRRVWHTGKNARRGRRARWIWEENDDRYFRELSRLWGGIGVQVRKFDLFLRHRSLHRSHHRGDYIGNCYPLACRATRHGR